MLRYIEFINEASKNNPPKSDLEIKKNKEEIVNIVQSFDDIFGTDYYGKFGSDYSVLTGTNVYFSKEVMEALRKEAMNPEMYNKFNFSLYQDNSLYNKLLMFYLSKEERTEYSLNLEDILVKKISKQSIMYKFFQKYGSAFDPKIISEVFEIKQYYDLLGSEEKMPDNLQYSILYAFKKALKHYTGKGKNNIIDTKEFFGYVYKYLDTKYINTHLIREELVKNRLNDWLKIINIS